MTRRKQDTPKRRRASIEKRVSRLEARLTALERLLRNAPPQRDLVGDLRRYEIVKRLRRGVERAMGIEMDPDAPVSVIEQLKASGPMTKKVAAKYLEVTDRTVRNYVRNGRLTPGPNGRILVDVKFEQEFSSLPSRAKP